MSEDQIQIFLEFDDSNVVDVSSLLIAGSLTIKEDFCNSEYRSTLNHCSWQLNFDEELFFMLRDYTEKINVQILDEYGEPLFVGIMEPVMDCGWSIPEHSVPIGCEAVDFSELLDEKINTSLAYPAEVGGVPFWIYKRENESMSILYRLLELCGLADRIDEAAPDIAITIEQVSVTEASQTYRDVIDNLLGDFSYCMTARASSLTWGKIAYQEFENDIEIVTESNIITGDSNEGFKLSKKYNTHNGVVINYPKTKVMEDALLWRGSLPIGDSADPTPGENIAAGDYWPEDSDIVETWMDFESTYLDTAYLAGQERLKNENIALLASSNQVVRDIKDGSVILDGSVVYESLRAKLRYINSGAETAKLYWSEIYGKALVQTAKPKAEYPEGVSNPKEYPSSYIFNSLDAQAAVEARYMMLAKGCWEMSFASLKDLIPGQVIRIIQPNDRWDGYALVLSRSRRYDFTGVWKYSLVSTAQIQSVTAKVTTTYVSGTDKPPQDGNTPRLIYTRATAKPATPVGTNPEGWTSGMPEGTAPLWMSSGTFRSTGDQVGTWTEPVRISGIDKGAYLGVSVGDPADPADGDFYIYNGETTAERIQYHYYRYSAASDSWSDTLDSSSVMAGWKDALQLAKDTGEVIYAAMLVVDILIANKLAVGGGSLTEGLLFRVMNDDGNGNIVIEARYNGTKVWWIDVDTGKMYGNFAEIRNVLPYQYEDSLDSTHPFEIDFFIPSDTVNIVSIKLSAKGLKYRGYSSALALNEWFARDTGNTTPAISLITNLGNTGSAGGHDHSYVKATGTGCNEGSHSHSLTAPWNTQSTGTTDGHSHSYSQPNGTTSGGTHSHSISGSNEDTSSVASHSHSVNLATGLSGGSHSHEFDISHTHALLFGIYEGTLPEDVNMFCDDGSGYGPAISLGSSSILASELNLASHFSGSGWKKLKFTSSTLGRITANLILQVDITA